MNALALLLEHTIEFSLLTLAALAAAGLLRRRSAALRHWILAAAVVAATSAPVLGFVVPSWRMPIGYASPPAASAPGGEIPRPAAPGGDARDARGEPRAAAHAAATAQVAAVWAAGAAIHALALFAGMWRLWRVRSRSRPCRTDRWARLALEIARRYGVQRDVLILQSDHPSILVTWGIARPKVVLPKGASEWTDERARIVLAHELAHVQRGDWLVQIAAEGLRAVQWFNPLAWLLCRRLRHESERAADDAVLNGGVEANAYAEHLLDVARAVRRHGDVWWPAPAIVGPSTLERRIRAMLNARLDRSPLTRSARLASAVALFALAAVIASAQGALATYSGAVLDPMNRTLPNAPLVLTDVKTNQKHQVHSDATGRFEFAGLPPGEYALEVKVPGFMALHGQVTMTGQNVQQTLHLALGTLQETITVKAAPGNPDDGRAAAPRPPVTPRAPSDCTPTPHGGNIKPPRKLLDVRPIYPLHLANAKAGGTVLMDATIAKDGTVKDVRVVRSAHADLDAAAVAAVRQWQFDSTLLNCMPTEVTMKVTINFVAE